MGFWDAASQGFQRGVGLGIDRYNADRELELKNREFDLRKRDADQRAELTDLQIRQARGLADATDNVRRVESSRTKGDVQDQEFEAASNAALAGKALPTYDAATWQADPRQELGQRDRLAARRGLAAARGDMAGLQTLDAQGKKLDVTDTFNKKRGAGREAYRDEVYARINLDGQMPFTIADVTDAKGKATGFKAVHLVGADGKAKQISLDQNQEEQVLLGISMIENGDETAGLQLIAGVNRDMAVRAKEVLAANVDATRGQNDAYAKYLGHEQDVARTGIAAQGLAIQRQRAQADETRANAAEERAAQADWSIVGASDDKKGLMYFNRRTGQMEVKPLPAGVNADGLLRKISGQPGALGPQDRARFVADMAKAGITDALQVESLWALASGAQNPVMAMVDALRAKDSARGQGGAPAKANPGPVDQQQMFRTMPLNELVAYTGTSPAAREIYNQRRSEAEALKSQPGFWREQASTRSQGLLDDGS